MIVFKVLKVFIILLTCFFLSMAIYKTMQEIPEMNHQPAHYFEIKFYYIVTAAGILLLGLMHLFTRKIRVMLD